jgi:hypothetical protein
MAQSKPRYFELHDHVGVEASHLVKEKDADGNVLEEVENPKAEDLAPLCSESMLVAFPKKVENGEVVEDVVAIRIKPAAELTEERPARIIPGTRVIETTSHQVAAALLANGKYQEVDPPASAQPRKPRNTSTTPATSEADAPADSSAEGKE